ncbi:hypothetical protein PM082_003412 [Marasmius tenuissimus]|nr:hypothetical protein PM082_003412 [Marasmius tenuissimus]
MSHAHDMGDMGDMGDSTSMGDSSSSHMAHMMVPYLHFTMGVDTILFESIVPNSAGAVFGVSLIFFLVSIFNQWLHGYRRGAEKRFAQRARELQVKFSRGAEEDKKDALEFESCCDPPAPRHILTHEISRAFLTGATTTLGYLLMLVVMTFNAAYIISVILGAVVGEFAFGRLHR